MRRIIVGNRIEATVNSDDYKFGDKGTCMKISEDGVCLSVVLDNGKMIVSDLVSSWMPVTLYQHDCDNCVSLGTFENADLYYCERQILGGPTIIARHSSDGADYESGIAFADIVPELGEALNRAKALGLIASKQI